MKLKYGVARNDSDYKVTENRIVNGKRVQTWKCPFYQKWSDMVARCYDVNLHHRYPSYVGCSVCEDWLTFSKFKAWMETQDWEGKQLDKDILCPGNKVYSPETCVFVSKELNLFMKIGEGDNIKYKGKYRCYAPDINGERSYMGAFDTREEAVKVYLRCKKERAIFLCSSLKDQRLVSAILYRFKYIEE